MLAEKGGGAATKTLYQEKDSQTEGFWRLLLSLPKSMDCQKGGIAEKKEINRQERCGSWGKQSIAGEGSLHLPQATETRGREGEIMESFTRKPIA